MLHTAQSKSRYLHNLQETTTARTRLRPIMHRLITSVSPLSNLAGLLLPRRTSSFSQHNSAAEPSCCWLFA